MVYNGTEDLQFDKYQKKQRAEQQHGNGEFVFDPQDLAKKGTSFSIAAHQMETDELEKYAKLATELRVRFTTKADTLAKKLSGSADTDASTLNF